jgi:hypothetical protein
MTSKKNTLQKVQPPTDQFAKLTRQTNQNQRSKDSNISKNSRAAGQGVLVGVTNNSMKAEITSSLKTGNRVRKQIKSPNTDPKCVKFHQNKQR